MRLIGLCDESFSRFNIELPFECLRLLDLRPQNMPVVFNKDEIISTEAHVFFLVFTLCYLNNDEIRPQMTIGINIVFTLCYRDFSMTCCIPPLQFNSFHTMSFK